MTNEKMTYGELKRFYKKSSISFSYLDDWWIQAAWELIGKNGHTKKNTFLEEIDTLSYAIGIYQLEKYIGSILGSGYESHLEFFDYKEFIWDMSMDEISNQLDEIIDKFDLDIDIFENNYFRYMIDDEIYWIILNAIQDRKDCNESEAKENIREFIKSFVKIQFLKNVLDFDSVYRVIGILKKELGREGIALSVIANDGKLEFFNEGDEEDPSYYCVNRPSLRDIYIEKPFYLNKYPDEIVLEFYEDNKKIIDIFKNDMTENDLNMQFFLQWIG